MVFDRKESSKTKTIGIINICYVTLVYLYIVSNATGSMDVLIKLTIRFGTSWRSLENQSVRENQAINMVIFIAYK